MTQFTPHQHDALKSVADWLKSGTGTGGAAQVFRLFGYAGTGKTTLARHIADEADGEVKFAAFTGKAASVMRGKGCRSASTIHSLIYRARESGEEVPNFDLWDEAPASKAQLIIIDECSMVDAELGRDLLSFGVPVLVLGDPAQLPPIQGGGFFTEGEPDAMLTEVHRQAQDDPIVRLSMDIRAGDYIEPGRYGETEVLRKGDLDPDRVLEADQVLVGRNATRRAYNARMRQRRGFDDEMPLAGDKLVCLRNDPAKGLLNGSLWKVMTSSRETVKPGINLLVSPEEDDPDRGVAKIKLLKSAFEDPDADIPWQQKKRFDDFDYGYALTVHKAQGSQWNDVVLFDESWAFKETRQRWLYTAITRAAERLTIVR